MNALRNQTRSIFHDLGDEDDRVVIKYPRKARNPHTTNVVIRTSPKAWQRAINAGNLHIDLQRVRVEDQSPLVQCTRCLGLGQPTRAATVGIPTWRQTAQTGWQASHPNGETAEEPDWRVLTEHNAFDAEWPIRKKWDEIARAAVPYCYVWVCVCINKFILNRKLFSSSPYKYLDFVCVATQWQNLSTSKVNKSC